MSPRALVVGAGGALGEACVMHLRAAGWAVTASMRGAHAAARARLVAGGAQLAELDLDDLSGAEALARGHEAAILTPVITLTAQLATMLCDAGVGRIVAFSSNNVALMGHTAKYAALAEAEAVLRARAPHAVLLRPTLIYGDARLATLTSVMLWARRLPVLPLPGSGRALQQPVYFDDLARAAAFLCASQGQDGRTFALGGPDVVSMRDLFSAVARAAGVRRPILSVPGWALRALAPIAPGLAPMQVDYLEMDKLAVAVDDVPSACAPTTRLADGLSRLASQIAG